MKTFREEITISKELADLIDHYLNYEPKDEDECFGEREPPITETINFGDGIEMDVQCCGVRDEEGGCNTAWTQAVLFYNGYEVCCSDVGDEFTGEWELEDAEGNKYVGVVKVAA